MTRVGLVSTVIPAHDRPSMLAQAVESVRAQTYGNIEIIIVLSAATEGTREVAHRLAGMHRAQVIETAKPNLSAARNLGVAAASGEWIAFLDDDDIWLAEKIEAQISAAEATGAPLVACNFTAFNEDGPIDGSGLAPLPTGLSMAESLMLGNYFAGGSAAVVKKAVLQEFGGFDESMVAAEDLDMWRRIAWRHKIFIVDRPLLRIRRHESSMVSNPRLMMAGLSSHFAKMLMDTPPHLQHMLPKAYRSYRSSLRKLAGQASLNASFVFLAPIASALRKRPRLRRLVQFRPLLVPIEQALRKLRK